jgi:phosphatidylserine decarboxylase
LSPGIGSLSAAERLNFLVTNRIPRRMATRFMGWFSRIESPMLTRLSMLVWQLFADDLRLDEAQSQRFKSLQACFTRQLKPGVRPLDQRDDVVISPCDAIVGACGSIDGTTVYQAKGFPYELADLIPDAPLREKYRDGVFVTLRLKSSMYHRFHAPFDGTLRQIIYISGDTWNVNPIALRRIEQLFCKNERAVLELDSSNMSGGICLVAVAAILVASIKLHALDEALDMNYHGPSAYRCQDQYQKGQEMGYFQHGSTILLFASAGHTLHPGICSGSRINMGQALLIKPHSQASLPQPMTLEKLK